MQGFDLSHCGNYSGEYLIKLLGNLFTVWVIYSQFGSIIELMDEFG